MKIEFKALLVQVSSLRKLSENQCYKNVVLRIAEGENYQVRVYKKQFADLSNLKVNDEVVVTCKTQPKNWVDRFGAAQYQIVLIALKIQSYGQFLLSNGKQITQKRSENLELSLPWCGGK